MAFRRALTLAPRLMTEGVVVARSAKMVHTQRPLWRAIERASNSSSNNSSNNNRNGIMAPPSVNSLFSDLDRMFGFGAVRPGSNFFGDSFTPFKDFPAVFKSFANMDLAETETSHIITMDTPGMKVEQIKVQLDKNNILSISGERKTEETPQTQTQTQTQNQAQNGNDKEGGNITIFFRSERQYGKFSRAVQLPDNIDRANVQASMKDGVLTITVPKLERTVKDDTISVNIKAE